MKTSIIYTNRYLYSLVLRMLYRGYYQERFQVLDSEFSHKTSVLELCFGDLYFYKHYLAKKEIMYHGIDINSAFVTYGKLLGLNVYKDDVVTSSFPTVNVVLIQASLYHFIDEAMFLLEKMWEAADHKIIVSEPVVNIAQSSNKLLAKGAQFLSRINNQDCGERFSERSLKKLMDTFCKKHQKSIKQVIKKNAALGRDAIYIFEKK